MSICCIHCLFSLLHKWRDNWHIFIKMFSTTKCAVSDCNAPNSPATHDAHRSKDTTSWNQQAGELHSQRRTTSQHNATFEDKSFVRLPTSTPPNNSAGSQRGLTQHGLAKGGNKGEEDDNKEEKHKEEEAEVTMKRKYKEEEDKTKRRRRRRRRRRREGGRRRRERERGERAGNARPVVWRETRISCTE